MKYEASNFLLRDNGLKSRFAVSYNSLFHYDLIFGQGELKNLTAAELIRRLPMIWSVTMCAFYLNEFLLRLLL